MNQSRKIGAYLQGDFERICQEAPAGFRAWLDTALGRVPAKNAADWQGRLNSGSPDLEATLFEILTLDLSERLGFRLQVQHPDLGNDTGGRRPDFLLRQGELDLVLEAKALAMQDENSVSRWHRAHALKRDLDKILAGLGPSFSLTVYAQGDGGLSLRELKKVVLEAVEKAGQNQRLRFQEQVPGLDFELWVGRQAFDPSRPVTSVGLSEPNGTFGVLRLDERIHRAVRSKLKHYGRLRAPMVVALGTDLGWPVDDEDLLRALLGPESLLFSTGPDAKVLGAGHSFTGLFGCPTKPSNTRLSGLLVLRGWTVRGFAQTFAVEAGQDPRWLPNLTWIPNPHAAYAVPDVYGRLPTWDFRVEGEAYHFEKRPGASLQDLLSDNPTS